MSEAVDLSPHRILRFWVKIKVGFEDECWLWMGGLDRKGYGVFRINAKTSSKAHIFSWVLHNYPVPKGLHVDHECNVNNCVNPRHLRLLTNVMNNARSSSPSAVNARKTSCIRGHPFDAANTMIGQDGARRCRQCARERNAKRDREAA